MVFRSCAADLALLFESFELDWELVAELDCWAATGLDFGASVLLVETSFFALENSAGIVNSPTKIVEPITR